MNLYLRELNAGKKSMLIWTACIAGMLFLSMAMFPSFSGGQTGLDVNALMQQFPEDMLKAFNIQALNFADPMDYYTYVYQYAVLAAGIWGMLLGASILAKEEGEKTIEFLYAKPVTRGYIFGWKLGAVLTQVLVFYGVLLGGSMLGFAAFAEGRYDTGALALLCLAVVLVQTVFASLGFLLGSLVVKTRKILPLSLGVSLGLYMVSVISSIKDDIEALRYLTPFQYFPGIRVIREGQLEWRYVILSLGIILVSLTAAWLVYRRKNILT